MKNKAIFLDRDGVINKAYVRKGKSYPPSNVKEFIVLDGVQEALNLSKKMGFLNIIVTNQPDITTGKQSLENLGKIHESIKKTLTIDDIFVCIHVDSDNCSCRKPLPGMLMSAKEKWQLDFGKSFLVGDRWRDIGAAQAACCESFFIDYEYNEKRPTLPYRSVSSLREAVHEIYSLTKKGLLR
jgi:D-glycero-D-manno-heptose 1,7-bisphosphate phosphatase